MDRLSFSALKLRQQMLSFFVYCLNVKMDSCQNLNFYSLCSEIMRNFGVAYILND